MQPTNEVSRVSAKSFLEIISLTKLTLRNLELSGMSETMVRAQLGQIVSDRLGISLAEAPLLVDASGGAL